jgi:hypothetical protein
LSSSVGRDGIGYQYRISILSPIICGVKLHQGCIKTEWATDNNRRAKYYSLTKPGRKRLKGETSKWTRLSAAFNLILAEGWGALPLFLLLRTRTQL